MDIFEVIRDRRSIRKYKPDGIPREHIERIFEAARLAPSVANRQPWRFVIVQNQKRKEKLAAIADNQMFLKDAGAIVIGVGDPDLSANWCEKDTIIAIEHIVLAAKGLGYGTCWIGAVDDDKIKKLLKIPERMKIVAVLPIGVPDEKPGPRPRRKLEEILYTEEWQVPWC